MFDKMLFMVHLQIVLLLTVLSTTGTEYGMLTSTSLFLSMTGDY